MVLTSIALLLLAINGVLVVKQLYEQEERIDKVYQFLREQNAFNKIINDKLKEKE